MGVSEHQKNEVNRLLKEGRKIEAIQYIRSNFNLDLKQAKYLSDHIEDELDINDMELTMRPRRSLKGANPGKLVGSVFLIIGLTILAINGAIFYNQSTQIENSTLIIGTVIDNPSQPIFEYQVDGQSYTFQSSVTSTPPSYYLDEEVEIFVDNDNPNDIIVNTISDRWFVIIFLGGFGVVFSLIGYGVSKVSG